LSDKKSKLSTFFTVQQSNKPWLSFDENISSLQYKNENMINLLLQNIFFSIDFFSIEKLFF
jgi:hypothetical protein